MPVIKEPPPRRRLGRATGDSIVALFEGQPSSSSTQQGTTTSSPTAKAINTTRTTATAAASGEADDEQQQQQPQQLVVSLFPTKFQLGQEVETNPIPAPRKPNQQQRSALAAGDGTRRLVSTEAQTDTGGAEFRLYELVLSTPSPHGIVTREHAAHRAMLERQISQRIVDARLDERFNRQSIEEARDLALEAIAGAFKFHSQAVKDLLYYTTTSPAILDDDENEGDENGNNDQPTDDPAAIDARMIAKLEQRQQNGSNGSKWLPRRPRFVPIEKYHQVRGDNSALRSRVDLLERRLQAQSQGIPYLVSTVRFPPPPPSIEVLEAEEDRFRTRIEGLEDELVNLYSSIWGAPSQSMVRAHRLRQQQQQQLPQQIQGLSGANAVAAFDAKIQHLHLDEAKVRSTLLAAERDERRSEVEDNAASRFTRIVRDLSAEKEKFKVRCKLLVCEAAEEASRNALVETVLDVRGELLAIFYSETKIKSELTRKLRNAMSEQHGQSMRHKKEMSKMLPPVAERVAPKNSSIRITPEARRAAAIALQESKHSSQPLPLPTSTSARRVTSGSSETPKTDSMFPSIQDKSSTQQQHGSATMTPRPPPPPHPPQERQQQQQQQQQQQPSGGTRGLIRSLMGASATSSSKAPLYNSGFSRPYSNLL